MDVEFGLTFHKNLLRDFGRRGIEVWIALTAEEAEILQGTKLLRCE